MSTIDISNWLNHIPSTAADLQDLSQLAARSSLKRQRPLTPDSTDADESRGSHKMPRTRRDRDDDPTPKAKRLQLLDLRAKSETSGSSASTKSGSQSPQKQIRAYARVEDGIETRELSSMQDPSPNLEVFLNKMESVAQGDSMLPSSMQSIITAHPDRKIARLKKSFFFSDERHLLGHTPSLQEVDDILQAAAECQGNFHSEATWNSWVHDKVLRLGLIAPGTSMFKQMISFMPCTTASILPDYLPSLKIAKKVDFCIYVDPVNDEEYPPQASSALVSEMSTRLADGVIGLTDYMPLSKRPIAISIETKKLGEGWNNATLQMSVWLAAQWNLLDQITPKGKRPDAALDFLPGIIIQGHNWFLVIATRESKKTVLWNKMDIGATDSIEGIYKLIYGLQVLRQWTRDTYWPAFRKRISSNIEAFEKSFMSDRPEPKKQTEGDIDEAEERQQIEGQETELVILQDRGTL